MFAAMVHPPNYPFDSIRKEYRESPYFTLDEDFMLNYTERQEEQFTEMPELEDITHPPHPDEPPPERPGEDFNANSANQNPKSHLSDLPPVKKGSHLTIAANS